jgi:hypothetical protein
MQRLNAPTKYKKDSKYLSSMLDILSSKRSVLQDVLGHGWGGRSHWWDVIATTTYDCPLIVRELPDGTLVEEGTRAYLEAMLAQMLTSPTKSDQDWSMTPRIKSQQSYHGASG